MPSPFPGMNPYLEHPDRWSTVHNRFIVAIADVLTPLLLPRYQVDIEKRIYQILEEVREAYLEIKEEATGRIITTIEILSPTNKRGQGRQKYEEKRQRVLSSRTHLVEIDLLRSGESLPMSHNAPSDYHVLISRETDRPAADLYPFNLQDPMPNIPIPLQPSDPEPIIDLKQLIEDITVRSGYSHFINYNLDPTPTLSKPDQDWLDRLLSGANLRSPTP
jgi:Protein of unknown function (DUF4058)